MVVGALFPCSIILYYSISFHMYQFSLQSASVRFSPLCVLSRGGICVVGELFSLSILFSIILLLSILYCFILQSAPVLFLPFVLCTGEEACSGRGLFCLLHHSTLHSASILINKKLYMRPQCQAESLNTTHAVSLLAHLLVNGVFSWHLRPSSDI